MSKDVMELIALRAQDRADELLQERDALRAEVGRLTKALGRIDKLHSCILWAAGEDPSPCAGCVARAALKEPA